MAAPNLAAVDTIIAKTAVQAVGTSATAIVSNGASSGKAIYVKCLMISNVDGTAAADITVDHYRSSTARHIVKGMEVPAGSTVLPIAGDAMVLLEEGDSLRLTGSATGDLEAVCYLEEWSVA
jgi:hypothetical protein